MPNGASRPRLVPPSPSAEEAAAIVAAIERFMRATAPPAPRAETEDPWRRAAILEGVERERGDVAPDPWINT
jgi:hypothetical protein